MKNRKFNPIERKYYKVSYGGVTLKENNPVFNNRPLPYLQRLRIQEMTLEIKDTLLFLDELRNAAKTRQDIYDNFILLSTKNTGRITVKLATSPESDHLTMELQEMQEIFDFVALIAKGNAKYFSLELEDFPINQECAGIFEKFLYSDDDQTQQISKKIHSIRIGNLLDEEGLEKFILSLEHCPKLNILEIERPLLPSEIGAVNTVLHDKKISDLAISVAIEEESDYQEFSNMLVALSNLRSLKSLTVKVDKRGYEAVLKDALREIFDYESETFSTLTKLSVTLWETALGGELRQELGDFAKKLFTLNSERKNRRKPDLKFTFTPGAGMDLDYDVESCFLAPSQKKELTSQHRGQEKRSCEFPQPSPKRQKMDSAHPVQRQNDARPRE